MGGGVRAIKMHRFIAIQQPLPGSFQTAKLNYRLMKLARGMKSLSDRAPVECAPRANPQRKKIRGVVEGFPGLRKRTEIRAVL
ncbi:hypothetical protein WN55_09318 [Dufourea novaeangliae]|uniref:Uncharacterized protein n=1 Tax=Dufourea novaeangliae TaxID=178035 RepID=A0A154PAL3_DUFNO|nr:hypothetical protein WN55_09318 [Dufourea novaeangliae]